MNLPQRPTQGSQLSPAWGAQVVDCLRELTPAGGVGIRVNRTPSGTVINAERDHRGGATAATNSTATPFPFEVFGEPISPVPLSGARETLKIRLGRVNRAVARMPSDPLGAAARWHMEVVELPPFVPVSTPYDAGAWAYVALRHSNASRSSVSRYGNDGASVIVADYIPEDEDEAEYTAIAAVRRTRIVGGTHAFEVVQLEQGDQMHRFTLPFEVAVRSHPKAAMGVANVRRGRVRLMAADMVSGAYFNNTSSFAGSHVFSAYANDLRLPSFSSGSYSLWFALEYPHDGTRLAAENHGKLRLTPTSEMPIALPWVVVVEGNTNTDAARGAADGSVPTRPAQQPISADAPKGGKGNTPAEAQAALAALFVAQPGDVDTYDYVDSAPEHTIENGLQRSAITRTYTRRVTRLGETVYNGSVPSFWSLTYTIPVPLPSDITSPGYNAGDHKLGASGSANPPPNYGDGTWNQYLTPNYHNGTQWESYLTLSATNVIRIGSGTINIISGGNRVGTLYTILDAREAYWGGFYGFWAITGTGAPTYTTVYEYGGGGGGGVTTPDSEGVNPAGDNPGRNPNRPISESPTTDTKATNPEVEGVAGKNALGNLVKAPGPGVWVWEIARIYPGGRVEQRHVGDILCHPAPQVQIRVNPKIAALP